MALGCKILVHQTNETPKSIEIQTIVDQETGRSLLMLLDSFSMLDAVLFVCLGINCGQSPVWDIVEPRLMWPGVISKGRSGVLLPWG